MRAMASSRFQLVLVACLLVSCRGHDGEKDGRDDAAGDVSDAGDLATDPDAAGPDAPDAALDPDAAGDAEGDASADVGEEDNPCIVPDGGSDAAADPGTDASLDAVADPDADPDSEDVGEEDVSWPFACGGLLRDPRDGQLYVTVQIGTQCWMAENLNVGTMIPGSAVQADNGLLEKHCYDDSPINCLINGALYQWGEMMAYGPSDAGNPSTTRGICPPGWHVPSDEEFKVLEMHVGMTRTEADMVNAWRGVGAGTALKPGGSSGYEALMSGRYTGGAFQLLGDYEYMYTSTEYGTMAWRRCLGLYADTVGRWNTFPKTWGLSVRCVLD